MKRRIPIRGYDVTSGIPTRKEKADPSLCSDDGFGELGMTWNNSSDLKAWIVPRWGAACCAPYKRGERFGKQLLLLWIAAERQHERASMDGGGDDDADADGHGADQDGQGHVVFLHDFFPQVIGR